MFCGFFSSLFRGFFQPSGHIFSTHASLYRYILRGFSVFYTTTHKFCQCMKENTMTVHIILQCTRKQTQRQCTYFWQCRRSKSLTVHIALSVYEREYNDWFYCMYIFKQCTRLQGYDNAHIFLIVNQGARLGQCT